MIVRLKIFIVWLLLFFGVGLAPVNAVASDKLFRAENGVLDLRNLPDLGKKEISLNGEWEFFWLQLIDPNNRTKEESHPNDSDFIHVPAIWSSQSVHGTRLSDQGYGTYRLTIKLPSEEIGQAQALVIPSIATAYQLWINEKPMASNGIVGTSVQEMEAQNFPKTIYFTPLSEELELTIQVSNYVQRKGGLWSEIKMGRAEYMTNVRNKNIMAQIAVVGGLFVMGIYHIALFLFRRNERSTLFFGIACLLIALRTLLVGEVLWFQIWPDFSWELGVKLEYLSAFIGIAFFVIYAYYLHPKEARKKITYGLFSIICVASIPILFLPARVYTNWMIYYQLILLVSLLYLMYVVILATIRRRKGAWINFVAMLILLLTVVNDILYYNHLIQTMDMVGKGLFLFIFAQALVLASRFSKSFLQVEKLSHQLGEANRTLEFKVKQRTMALEKSNQKLKQEEASRKNLLSNISHELGTPLTSLTGYIIAMKKGYLQASNPKYIHVIYEKAMIIQRLMDDLKKLVRLESTHTSYSFKAVAFQHFFQTLDGQYQLDAEKRGIQLKKIEITPQPPTDLELYADIERLGQVVTNFIANAIAHTDSGGEIIVSGKYFHRLKKVVIFVQDTGIGIKEIEQKKVFERFYKGENKLGNSSRGSGLGLAICKEIIEMHEGRIGMRSKENVGSTFYFILPIYRSGQGREQ